MADDSATENGIVPLWPTFMLRRSLADHGTHEAALIKLVRELERGNRQLTTEYLDSDFFTIDEPPVRWLKTSIDETIIDYLKWLGLDYPVNWAIQGWPNVNRFGDYHDYHNHPRAYLSGTYYLKMPKSREKLETRDDVRPGAITFYDPRYGANMHAIKGDPYAEAEFTVLPEPGLLMMWPGFINHFVHPNLSKELRITISFNIVLKWSDDYLPDQR